MPKYEVPLHYTVWIPIEAETESEAWDKAGEPGSDTDFTVTTKYLNKEGGPEINFIDAGQPHQLENENA